MTHYAKKLLERVRHADIVSVNRIRIITILMAAFVFGVGLRISMFGPAVAQEQSLQTLPLALAVTVEAPSPDPKTEPAAQEQGSDSAPPVPVETVPEEPEQQGAPEPLTISANAAILINGFSLRSVSYQKSADERFAPASLTKLMTAVVVTEQLPSSELVQITSNAVAAEGAAGGLAPGEILSAGNLMRVMLTVSSNDAAEAFAGHFVSQGRDLVALMNEKAARLGMQNTHFANASGLDAKGHYTSARDLAALTLYSLQYQNIWDALSRREDTVSSEDGKITHRLVSNNELLQRRTPGFRAGKTGYTKNAGECMIAVLDSGSVSVVLGSSNRAVDTEKLIKLAQTL